MHVRAVRLPLLVLVGVLATGCSSRAEPPADAADEPSSPIRTSATGTPTPSAPATPSERSAAPSSPAPSSPAPSSPKPRPEPRRSFLDVPAIGVRGVPVVRYRGSPDDAAGSRLQDEGPTASPRGPRGGVGPGRVGNFLVTGHRTSHAAPFRDLPALDPGDRVLVRSAGRVFTYRVTRTRSTSFRSPASLRAQSAAVPGRPGVRATRAMITLSTCATPEDHAAGNYWSDRFGNPEHRIDKIGVLVAVSRA